MKFLVEIDHPETGQPLSADATRAFVTSACRVVARKPAGMKTASLRAGPMHPRGNRDRDDSTKPMIDRSSTKAKRTCA
ncbi:MAG: hypothetical protein HYV96_03320 [Opitutae bacterium]|nr:hypothetical protein [Opitutae bacterium]